MSEALRAKPVSKRKRGRPYNQPSHLHLPWLRVAELSAATREALTALDAGKPAVARAVLARVAEPDVS